MSQNPRDEFLFHDFMIFMIFMIFMTLSFVFDILTINSDAAFSIEMKRSIDRSRPQCAKDELISEELLLLGRSQSFVNKITELFL
jgi:hypothetical protein